MMAGLWFDTDLWNQASVGSVFADVVGSSLIKLAS